MPAEIPYYMPYLRPAEYQEYLRKKAIEEVAAKYPYVPPPETYAEALERAKVEVAKREAAVAKPFPWKWVIIGGIVLFVGYSIVKK